MTNFSFEYGLFNRPVMIGTIPAGIEYELAPRPDASSPHYAMARHGILKVTRELTPEETKSYELSPLLDAQAVSNLASLVADRMARHATEYLEANDSEPEIFAHAVSNIASKCFTTFRPSFCLDALKSNVLEILRNKVQSDA